MKNYLTTGLFLVLYLTTELGYGQCSAPEVTGMNCEVTGASGNANCHGFATEYLKENYQLGYVDCYNPSSSDLNAINDCATASFSFFSSLYSLLEPTTAGASDVDVITYEESINGSWVVHHSAVNLKYNGYYLSKWESCGPVVRHYATSIGLPYYQSNNSSFRIRYWREKPVSEPTCTTPSLSLSACTSCSCATSEGYFLVSGSSSGWTNHSWSVSGAAIAWNFGSYIYVDKPGGGSVGVTLTATYSECNETKSKYESYNFPYCSSGGFSYYRMDREPDVSLGTDKKTIRIVLPEAFNTLLNGPELSKGTLNVNVYRLDGRLLTQQVIHPDQPVLDLERVPEPGIYVVNVYNRDQKIISEKLAIR